MVGRLGGWLTRDVLRQMGLSSDGPSWLGVVMYISSPRVDWFVQWVEGDYCRMFM